MPVGGGSGARWNVVTKYSPGVLIGNWQEERMLVSKLTEEGSQQSLLLLLCYVLAYTIDLIELHGWKLLIAKSEVCEVKFVVMS